MASTLLRFSLNPEPQYRLWKRLRDLWVKGEPRPQDVTGSMPVDDMEGCEPDNIIRLTPAEQDIFLTGKMWWYVPTYAREKMVLTEMFGPPGHAQVFGGRCLTCCGFFRLKESRGNRKAGDIVYLDQCSLDR